MRHLFLALFLFLLTSSAWSDCRGVKNHVFLLHGIGGNKKTFGALEKILPLRNPCLVARTFEYRTGSKLTTYDFAADFDAYVTKLRKGGEISTNEKISLIMHSQGGLVGTIWLKSLVDRKSFLLPQLDAFITLSTPLWGADIAHIGQLFFHTLPPGVSNPISPFGRNELNEMSYGSHTILDFTRHLDDTIRSIPGLRPLFLAGMRSLYGPFLGEDDLVVPSSSMRPSRFSVKDAFELNSSPMTILNDAFKKAPTLPFAFVPATHIYSGAPGIADVPESCFKNCAHPTLPIILKQLSGEKIETEMKPKLTRFQVSIYVTNPTKMLMDLKELTLMLHGFGKEIRIQLVEQFTTEGNANLVGGKSFSFAGILKNNTGNLKATLKYKNLEVRTYNVPVEAGYFSFIDAELIPEH